MTEDTTSNTDASGLGGLVHWKDLIVIMVYGWKAQSRKALALENIIMN